MNQYQKLLKKGLKQRKIIDYVLPSHHSTAEKNIKLIKPDYYFKGEEYKKNKTNINCVLQ